MIQVNSSRLSNGLRVLHHYDDHTRMAAFNILYDVGARDEQIGRTGLAHLMEHLMFSGSENVPSYDGALQAAGGESNAWTTNDMTNYYEVLPAQNIENAFWVESDRLLSLTLSEQLVEIQKGVVCEEFKQRNLNQPYGDVYHLLHAAAYECHPYKWPTIGMRIEDVEHATTADVRNFYQSHYSVDRAILCVSGHISFEKTMELARKWFGDIAPRATTKRQLPVEPEQTEPRTVWAKRTVPDNLIVRAYHMCSRTDSRYQATDLLSDILSNGDSSRFYRNLVTKSGLFIDLDASVSGNLDPGLFYIRARLCPGVKWQQAEQAIDGELRRLFDHGVTQHEVTKFTNKFIANSMFDNVGYADKAAKLCQYELQSAACDINSEYDRYRAITPNQIVEVAKSILRPTNCTTLYYGPNAQ